MKGNSKGTGRAANPAGTTEVEMRSEMSSYEMDVMRAEMRNSLQRSRDAEAKVNRIIENETRAYAASRGVTVEELSSAERVTAEVRARTMQSLQDAEVTTSLQLDRARTYALAYLVEADAQSRGRSNPFS